MEFSLACWNVYHFVSELVEEGRMCEWVVSFSIFSYMHLICCAHLVQCGYEEVKSEKFLLHLVGRGEPATTLVIWELQGLQSLTVNLSEPSM